MTATESNIVWLDLEMTGLNPDEDQILEIATIITDDNLDNWIEGPDLVIHCPEDRLLKMDDWNREHHSKSGLWQKCLSSKISLEQAEAETLEFIKRHSAPSQCPLAGNSIWQDRRFLANHMKSIESYLHYRIIDVSSIKELIKRWYPKHPAIEKKGSHRAMDDIKESIEELRFYRNKFFVVSPP